MRFLLLSSYNYSFLTSLLSFSGRSYIIFYLFTIHSSAKSFSLFNVKIDGFGQVDYRESSETPELTEMKENLTKATKLKETLINYAWEKFYVKKNSKNKISRGFRVFE